MKSLKCRDVGMDCDYEIRGQNEQEVIKKAEEHGREKHGLTQLNDKLLSKIKSQIREIKAA